MTHVIHNLNCQELEKMAEIDAAIGADKVRFYLARLDENINHLKLGNKDIERIKAALPIVEDCFRNKNIVLQDNIYFQLENYDCQTGFWSKNKFNKSGCLVGWFFCLVLAKGEVSMCCHLRLTGHLKEKSFKEIWDSQEYNDTRIKAKRLAESMDVNNQVYDESCSQCDTHQVILRIEEMLKRYKLDNYLEGIKK
jgi:MoaA/NifB/PqqE/SkfB family radical SAM enzyme